MGLIPIIKSVMSDKKNTSENNPNSLNDPQNELRDQIQVLPEEWGWEQNDLEAFQVNNWDGE